MFPEVENPIPETIGLGSIFSAAGAGGVLLLVVAILLGHADTRRDAWSRLGMLGGFIVGLGFYLMALLAQLFCRQ